MGAYESNVDLVGHVDDLDHLALVLSDVIVFDDAAAA